MLRLNFKGFYMPPQLKEIERQAILLSPDERESLIQTLLLSLDDAPLTEIDDLWIQEAERRYKDYKNGITKGIPGDRIFAEIRRELGWLN